jgi:hypothetical protein
MAARAVYSDPHISHFANAFDDRSICAIYTCSYTFVKHLASITLLVNLGERSRSPSQRLADARVLDAMAFYGVGCGQ